MSSPSNLYAEKVFAEHPLEMWSLNDGVNYLSLISEEQRNPSVWTITNGSFSSSTIEGSPFPESDTYLLSGDTPLGDASYAQFVTPDLGNFQGLNSDLATVSIGSYFYIDSPYITSIEIGYQYVDILSGEIIQELKYFSISAYNSWVFINETFSVPTQSTNYSAVVKFSYLAGEPTAEYNLHINGLSIGQWAEEFQSTSLGKTALSMPSNISIADKDVVPALPYGLSDSTAYYLVEEGKLLAKNAGMPMVYGGNNNTKIYPASTGPSIIFPGNGFLNESGKYREMTAEFWLRISQDSSYQQKIFGPIASNDGIYVRGPFLLIAIGNQTASYYVGEWGRPMLINFTIANNTSKLLVNGEVVASIDIDLESVQMADLFDENGKVQDWLGFYSYTNFNSFEIDCFALYPYQVPAIVAKRKFVYGQGVEFPENINKAYSGTSAFIDYRFADYANNYSYPGIGKWSQGIADNLSIADNTLSPIRYDMPQILLSNKTEAEWVEAIQIAPQSDPTAIKLLPDPSWEGETNAALYFDNFNFISGGTESFFILLEEAESSLEDKPVMLMYDKATGNYLEIKITGQAIEYIIRYNAEPRVFASTGKFYPGQIFAIGLNLKNASNYFGGDVAAFLGRRSSLSAYVGGTKDLTNTLKDNIYRVVFLNARQTKTAKDFFGPEGLSWGPEGAESFVWDSEYLQDPQNDFDGGLYSTEIVGYVADGGSPAYFAQNQLLSGAIPGSYTLFLSAFFGKYFLDAQAFAYWEDQIPLSYFGRYVEDAVGDKYYDLDFIQFNIDYPAPSQFFEIEETTGSWNYEQLYGEYANPVQRSYTSLDSQLYTGYDNYEDLQNKSSKLYGYNTSSSMVKSYITFQYLQSGANSSRGTFTNTISAPKNGVIYPGTEWVNTRYEVVDNMIIYPPQGASFEDLAIVMHVEIVSPGTVQYPIKVRQIQLASQSLDVSKATAVGTRFGVPVYPFTKAGIYYDFKKENPFSIYKDSSPYLYLTSKSGIQSRGNYDPLVSRGLAIPLNQNKLPEYRIIAFQSAIRYSDDFFPFAPIQLMEIESRDRLIKIYARATHPSGSRAKIYAINGNTGEKENGLVFYWNGLLVKEPSFEVKQWGTLGIGLAESLVVDNVEGAFRIVGPILANSISHYQSTNLQEVQEVSNRPWFRVKQLDATTLEWDFWNQSYIWDDVLIVSTSSFYGVSPADIYKTYTGNNKFIVDDNQQLLFNNYKYSILNEVGWQTQTVSPV